jgi:hypothetical protein
MSYIDIENDTMVLSSSPIENSFIIDKKYYQLYYSIKNNIKINGSFLFNNTNEPTLQKKVKNKIYFKNIEKLHIESNIVDFYINITNLNIENYSDNIKNFIYLSDIKIVDNIKKREIIILFSNPIIINISYNMDLASNIVYISIIDDKQGCSNNYILYNNI